MRNRYLIQCLVASLAVFGLVACGDGTGPVEQQGQQCDTVDDCNDGELCRKGVCLASCEADDDCAEASGDTCRLGGICVDDCESDEDCADGYACEQTTQSCWPEDVSFDDCDSYRDCEATEYCGSGTCLPAQCSTDADCAGQHICDAGSCVQGCRLNPQGDDQQEVPCEDDNKECDPMTNLCEDVGCSGMTDCGQHQMCDMDEDPPTCIYTGSCDNDAICAAYADQIDSDIPYTCQGGECKEKPPCEGDGDCGADEICVEKEDDRNVCRDGCRCTDGCDRSCPLGEVCSEESKCVPGCTSDAECENELGAGHVCSGNQCRQVCEGFSDCSEGFTCRSDGEGNSVCQHCTDDNQCPPEKFCKTEETGRTDEAEQDPNVGLCADVPPACPKDGYGDNHAEPDAYVIDDLPFEPARDARPKYCRTPTSNPEYSNDGHDWWRFSAETDKVIDVEVKYNTEAGNLDMALYNSSGRELVTSARPPGTDPGTENGEERIVYGVDAADDFLVQVRGTLTQDNVDYDLNIDVRDPQMCDDDGYEDNDSVDSPQTLPSGQSEMALNVCGDDKDFYELNVDANQLVNVVVQDAPERLGDLDLVLYDSNGQVLEQKRESSGGKHQLTFNSEEAGTYIVEVRVVAGVGRIDYAMEWDQRDNECADRFEVNDNCPDEATKLTRSKYVGQTQTLDNLAVCKDKDFYAIDLNPKDKITVEASYDYQNTQAQLQLLLAGGPDGVCDAPISAKSDSSKEGNIRTLSVSYEVPTTGAGTYYIVAQRFQGPDPVHHEFDVKIEATQCTDDGDEPNDTQSSATSLDRNSIINSKDDSALLDRKTCDANADWYCTSVQSGEDIKYEIRFDNSQGDLDAFLYDPNGTQFDKSEDSNADRETVSAQAQTAGEHCVKVQAKTAARNNYKLLTWIDGDGPNDPECPDNFENNDSCSSTSSCDAATMTPASYTSLLACSGDDDWYKTCVDPGQRLTVDADFKGASGNLDMYLWEEHADFTDETQAVASGETVSDFSNKAQCYRYKVVSQFGDHDYDLDVSTSAAQACTDDGSEPNDSASNATSLEAPGLIAERKKCEGNTDWYAVDLESGKDFEAFIPHDVDVADLDLTLYEGSGSNQVAQSSSSDDDESLTHTPTTNGTYYIEVDSKNRARIDYELLLYVDENENGSFDAGEGPADRHCPDQFEDNDGQSGAAQVGVGNYGHLSVCNGSRTEIQDDDFYEIFVPKDATLTAETTFTHDDGDIDMKMYRGSVGSSSEVSQSPSSSSSSTNNKEQIQHTNSQAGETYYIEVYSPRTAQTYRKNYYELSVTLGFGGTCNEDQFSGNNDSQSNAAALSAKDYDGSDSLMLCEKDPNNNYSGQDWFELTPSSNGQATFALEHRTALGEIHMELRDSNGTVAQATSEFGGNVKLIDNQSLTGGTTYYLKIHPDGKVIRNAYDLWAAFDGSTPSEPLCPDNYERNDESTLDGADPISLSNDNIQLTDPIACGSERDWYRVDLSGGTQYHFDTFFSHASDTDLAIEVQDDSGNVVQDNNNNDITFSSHSSDNDEQATFTPSTSDTYLLGVENTGSGQTTYPMQVIADKSYNNQSDCPEDNFEPNASTAPASLPDGSGIYSAAVCSSSGSFETDYYQVSSKDGGDLTVEVLYNSDQASLNGRVFGPSGNRTNLSGSGNRLTATVSGLSQGDAVDIEVGGANTGETSPYFLRIVD